MKFDYYKKLSIETLYPEYHFQFSLTEDEIRKVTHKYGFNQNWMQDVFYCGTNCGTNSEQMLFSLRILQDAATDTETIDLGINYKEKYKELEKLLEPYKIDENMPPSTTLKMLLKYHVDNN